MTELCYWTDFFRGLGPWLYTAEALAYNVPALLLLAWLLWRRPVMGILITILVYGRVIAGTVPWSMHACLATVALNTRGNGRMGGLGRWAGAALWMWTAYFYTVVFGVTLAPIILGTIMGAFLLATFDAGKAAALALTGR